MGRKSLSEILHGDERQRLSSAWDSTAAADEFAPLPAGEYVARVESGELATSKAKGTPSYKLAFRVTEGEHAGRRFWHDIYLTEAALAMAKRDLGKLGVASLDQLDRPLPQGIICAVKLALRTGDDGAEFNRVKSFAVVRIDEPEADAFAPDDTNGEADGDPSFPLAANSKPAHDAAGGAA